MNNGRNCLWRGHPVQLTDHLMPTHTPRQPPPPAPPFHTYPNPHSLSRSHPPAHNPPLVKPSPWPRADSRQDCMSCTRAPSAGADPISRSTAALLPWAAPRAPPGGRSLQCGSTTLGSHGSGGSTPTTPTSDTLQSPSTTFRPPPPTPPCPCSPLTCRYWSLLVGRGPWEPPRARPLPPASRRRTRRLPSQRHVRPHGAVQTTSAATVTRRSCTQRSRNRGEQGSCTRTFRSLRAPLCSLTVPTDMALLWNGGEPPPSPPPAPPCALGSIEQLTGSMS